MKRNHLGLALLLAYLAGYSGLADAQSAAVSKSNPTKVYVHYMPWAEGPDNPVPGGSYAWGWHWTMNSKNPNIVDGSGKRQIASHYYPIIGPYSGKDPQLVEYHLMLMKLSGIDGVLIDWYGSEGSNPDVGSLLNTSNVVIDRTGDMGLKFGLILEDRFWGSIQNARNSVAYARNNYFKRANYIRAGGANSPLVGIFGPITYKNPGQWSDIMSNAGESVELLPLWYQNNDAGNNAKGEYAWIYSDGLNGVRNFYANRAPNLGTTMGIAYPGFHDYYVEGGAGSSYFYLPENNGATLADNLAVFNQYRANLDALQLATWNDFGEGTVFEPTLESGYRNLVKIQQFTGVPYTENDLRQVYRLYTLRKKFFNDAGKQSQLNTAAAHFNALRLNDAVAVMNSVEGIGTTPPSASPVQVSEHCNYGGVTVALPVGRYTLGQLQARGVVNDWISSVRVQSGYAVTFYQDDNFSGRSVTKTGDNACLTSDNFNDLASSIVVSANAGLNLQFQAEDYSENLGVATDGATDEGGGRYVGWIDNGDWVAYNNITIPTSGAYTVEYRVASLNGGRLSLDLNGGTTALGEIDIPATGGWQNWQTITQRVNINAGTYNFGIFAKAGGWNLNWFRIKQ